jgi:hypothetical protein
MNRFPLLVLALVLAATTASADAARRTKHHKPPVPSRVVEVESHVVTVIPVAAPGAVKSAWAQYGPGGVLEARAVVEGETCPQLAADLHLSPMQKRAAKSSSFLTVCLATIPVGTKQAALVSRPPMKAPPSIEAGTAAERAWIEEESNVKYDLIPLALPVADPRRIVVLGDTGCRIKDKTLQDCSDPAKWPFARIAAEAARLKPDLVIHVGDYLYRESACPADFSGCTGTPFGDNWPTWDVDFFAPARPLLAAAPWVIVRGNHEDCERAGPGFLRLLGPTAYDPAAPCAAHVAPYTVPLGGLDLVVLDNSDAPDTSVAEASVPVFRQELAALGQAKTPSWLVLHRPIWAAITGPLGMPIGGNLTTIAAAGSTGIPAPVELMLAGHIHTFEAINYWPKPHVPPQIVAGNGGDLLDETPSNLHGTVFQGSSGVRVSDGISIGGFGFLLMTKAGDGWTIDVHDWQGRIERQCVFRAGRLDCPARR